MKKKFRIKYKVLLENEESLEDKEIKIDNCLSEIHAQSKLENYLKKKYINFKKLIVFECKEESDFSDFFSQFEDIFRGGDSNLTFGGMN
jgi:hypothetical protein